MGNHISRAKYMSTGAYAVNFGTQVYGMLTSPNMKDIADANHFAFSPHPMFIAAFFTGQSLLQLYWLYKLYKLMPDGTQVVQIAGATHSGADDAAKQKAADEAVKVATRYAPFYALGNICIAGWLFFWLREEFRASQVLVAINTITQLYAVAQLPAQQPNSPTLLKATHLVAKTFAGIGVLDFLDNGGVAAGLRAPPPSEFQVLTYVFFPGIAAMSGPLFGLTLVYDLVAIWAGQRDIMGAKNWPSGLAWTAIATAMIVGFKSVVNNNRA